jgi:Flp pilus assembly protein TadG
MNVREKLASRRARHHRYPLRADVPIARRDRRDPLRDRGSVAVLMCYIVLLGATLTTFLVDAGTTIQAANKADTYSSEAARAASIAVGPVPTDDGTSTLRAADAARTYLTQAGVTNYVVTVVGPATVQVRVVDTESTPILGFSVSQTRTHVAQLQIGVTSGQAEP